MRLTHVIPLLCTSLVAGTFALAQERPLFTNGIDDWEAVAADGSSFQYDEGVLRVSGSQGWLRSPRPYGDFELRGQVRFVEPDSDSGIFLRVESGTDFIRGWPGDAYQVQMRDVSVNDTDSPLPLAHLYRHRVSDGPTDYQRDRVFSLYTGVGQWQDFTIRVMNDTLTVDLDGERVTDAGNLENPSGYLGFQSEAGLIEYRALSITEF